MKILTNPVFRIFLILTAWFFCIRKLYLDFNQSQFLDFDFPGLVVLASFVSLFSFWVDYVRYKKSKRLVFFIPTVFTVLSIAAVMGTNRYLKQQDRIPTVLYASESYGELTNISIKFRKNGTYKCTKGSFFGTDYYARGKYSIKDSIVYLDKANLFDLVISDRLKMVTIPKTEKEKKRILMDLLPGSDKSDTLPKTYLFQLDSKGDTISSAPILEINNNFVDYID